MPVPRDLTLRICRFSTWWNPQVPRLLWVWTLLCGLPFAAQADPVDADWLLTGATVIDGTGQPRLRADIALRGQKIVAVGTFERGTIAQEIDCRGLVIAPGFIDLHNHSDSQVVDPQTRANVNFLMQGCTTIVTGNCGSGPVDARDYYRRLEESGCGTHVAHLLPQGSLREQVVGLAQRDATPDELQQMRDLARQAMEAGAWGLSTGLIYVPSSYASTAEIASIAQVVGQTGGLYVSHIRGEGLQLLAAVDEALDIGTKSGCPVHISHFKASGEEAWGLVQRAAARIEQARSAGQNVTADQYPYIASSTSLEATLLPAWARAGGNREMLARLEDPETGPRVRQAIEQSLERTAGGARIRLARYARQPLWAGKSLADLATERQTSPLELVLEIVRGGGAAVVNFGMREEDVRFVMALPWVATASDGRAYLPGADRPHPRSYGTFPRKIGHYAQREQVVTLEQAIRSATSLPAAILGLKDRGRLEPGLVADLVVFDPESFIDQATYDDPHAYATGVRHVFVAGEPAVWKGSPTGALRGRPLRRPPPRNTTTADP